MPWTWHIPKVKKAAIFAPDRDSQHFSRVHHELVARSRFQGDANVVEGLRCQALRVINEMRASQIIRRALLRKTRSNKDESKNILPGSLAARWRWTKRSSGKKRGGYVLGRLLLHDADGKSALMQAGSTTVQVAYEQLRPAYGLESWTPSM